MLTKDEVLIIISLQENYLIKNINLLLKNTNLIPKIFYYAKFAINELINSSNKYKLIIFDYNLIKKEFNDGFKIYHYLKNKSNSLKSIMLLSDSTRELRREALIYGIDVLVEKPFTASELLDAIKTSADIILKEKYMVNSLYSKRKVKTERIY